MSSNPRDDAPDQARVANQRADAQRNRASILVAAPRALRRNPEASVAEIAAEAGLGRMTVYGHFKTRAELIDAAVIESLGRGEDILAQVPLDGPPAEAFGRLIESSWTLLNEARGLLAAAQRELPSERVRELHAKAEARVRGILERGQQEGVFRTDLPIHWLLTTTHVVINAAADEVVAGLVTSEDASRLIIAVLQPAIAAASGREQQR